MMITMNQKLDLKCADARLESTWLPETAGNDKRGSETKWQTGMTTQEGFQGTELCGTDTKKKETKKKEKREKLSAN